MMDFSKRAKEYSNYRKADIRLTNYLEKMLGLKPGAVIADIGAGTGNYSAQLSDKGYSVYAVEPELAMIENSPFTDLHYIHSSAEEVALPNASVDGVIAINCVHHFSDLSQAFHEMHRILKNGKFSIFTFDPTVSSKLWIYDYWPDLVRYEFESYLPMEKVLSMLKDIFGKDPSVDVFKIPADFQDRFSAALWKNPDDILSHSAINAMSLFNSLSKEQFMEGYQQLQRDVASGYWHERYSCLLKLDSLDVGARVIVVEK